jgi:hypothetical protein
VRDEQWREHKRQVFRDWYAKNPRSKEKTIEQHLATRHGMRPEDRDAMREDQGGRCCYCERPLPENPRQIHIDHDHSCTCGPKKSCQYCRRGLACEACNTVIGKVAEDWDRLERMAANGRRLQAEAQARINGKPVQAQLFDINQAARRHEEESALWLLAKAWGVCSTLRPTSAGTPATPSASA